ncbi:MAG: MarR family transcriptional regulator [Bacteroidota bacterium]
MQEQKILALIDNIISVKPMFYKTLGKPVPMSSDITPGAYYALMYLKKHDMFSMSDLGKMLQISKPNVTALVNKLIAKGFVIRSSDKLDRRLIMIRLSAKGSQFIEKNNKKYFEQIKSKLQTLSDEELESFSISLQNVKDTLLKISIADINELKN